MAEDPALPSLATWSLGSAISSRRPSKRARPSSPVPSSDSALFSSDDDPSLDNYTRGRQKKQYRGPWFQQEPASDGTFPGSQFKVRANRDGNHKSKRIFERQYDSGVFLGSDCTDMDESSDDIELPPSRSMILPSSQAQSTQTLEPTPEELARKQIENCIEHGLESIDLSCQNLTSISNDTLRPLGALTPIHPRFDGIFFAIEPRLQIFLASNKLSNLPEELFNLHDLTVLSLRSNKLHELPPAIGRLKGLVELNISQNKLQYLPYEILNLFSERSRLETFQIHPNMFYEPTTPQNEEGEASRGWKFNNRVTVGKSARQRRARSSTEYPAWKSHPRWKICYKARTEISYLDINGSHCKGPQLSNNTRSGQRSFPGKIPIVDVDDTPVPPTSRTLSRVPSLLEVALNACSKAPELPSLQSMLPDAHPEHFPSLLAYATVKKESGGSKCTVCNRNFIVPRTEWIEWWEIAKAEENTTLVSAASPLRQIENDRDAIEKMVPLMRRGCSWLCVSDR